MSTLLTSLAQTAVDEAPLGCACGEVAAYVCDFGRLGTPGAVFCGKPLCHGHVSFWDLAPGKVLVRCPRHKVG